MVAQTPLRGGRPSIAVATPLAMQIEWAPMASGQRLPFNGTSYLAVREALTKTFGAFPIRLSRADHLATMRGMAAVAAEGAEPYAQLAAALDKFGELEIRDV